MNLEAMAASMLKTMGMDKIVEQRFGQIAAIVGDIQDRLKRIEAKQDAILEYIKEQQDERRTTIGNAVEQYAQDESDHQDRHAHEFS